MRDVFGDGREGYAERIKMTAKRSDENLDLKLQLGEANARNKKHLEVLGRQRGRIAELEEKISQNEARHGMTIDIVNQALKRAESEVEWLKSRWPVQPINFGGAREAFAEEVRISEADPISTPAARSMKPFLFFTCVLAVLFIAALEIFVNWPAIRPHIW